MYKETSFTLFETLSKNPRNYLELHFSPMVKANVWYHSAATCHMLQVRFFRYTCILHVCNIFIQMNTQYHIVMYFYGIDVHIYAHIHVYIYIYIYTHTHISYIYVYAYINIYIYICVCV